jgi:nuclear transport factor 2 (NTF2) superfamily protein
MAVRVRQRVDAAERVLPVVVAELAVEGVVEEGSRRLEGRGRQLGGTGCSDLHRHEDPRRHNRAMHTEIEALYRAFNTRDVDTALAAMTEDVHWPNGWEGGYVEGRAEVREYWRRQWAEIDPHVDPVAIEERPDGRVAVRVHQLVRDLDGKVMLDGEVAHIYRFEDGLIAEMTIEE